MKKYFFFDIDGTLTMAGTYRDSTRETVRLLQRRGHVVSIATGRLQADAWTVAQSLGIAVLISDGGEALTVDGRVLYHRGLPIHACRLFFKRIDRERYPFAVVPYNRKLRLASSTLYEEKVQDHYYETRVQEKTDFHAFSTIYKIFVACGKNDMSHIPLGRLPYVWFRDGRMLIEPTHKEKGIQDFQQRYGVGDGQVVVFGDGLNDLSMFRREWFSVAMGNGKDILKAKADYVTDSAEEDGIYNACRRFGWI